MKEEHKFTNNTSYREPGDSEIGLILENEDNTLPFWER
jgi:hypothetical protein